MRVRRRRETSSLGNQATQSSAHDTKVKVTRVHVSVARVQLLQWRRLEIFTKQL